MQVPQGLYIIPNWITKEQEQEIVDSLCKEKWSFDVSATRPTQYYGIKPSQNTGGKSYYGNSLNIINLQEPLKKHASKLESIFSLTKIEHVLVNMYMKDSYISPHVDKNSPEVIFGLSIVGDINMDWTSIENPNIKCRLLIPKRSLYIMTGDSSTKWMHSVPSLKRVYYPDTNSYKIKPESYVRVSLTFRHFSHAIVSQPQSQITTIPLSSGI